jgi:hypothetical protein
MSGFAPAPVWFRVEQAQAARAALALYNVSDWCQLAWESGELLLP